jgi:hypothetical protein
MALIALVDLGAHYYGGDFQTKYAIGGRDHHHQFRVRRTRCSILCVPMSGVLAGAGGIQTPADKVVAI